MKNLGKNILNYFIGKDIREEYFWSVPNPDQALKSENKYLFFGVILPNIATATGIGLSIGFQNFEYLSISASSEYFRNAYKWYNKKSIKIIKMQNKIDAYENGLKTIENIKERKSHPKGIKYSFRESSRIRETNIQKIEQNIEDKIKNW
jgi:hypothetical protein